MTWGRSRLLYWCTVVLVIASGAGARAFGETWPSRTVRVMVPYAAGSGSDIVARQVFHEMAVETGGSFVVENRPGAGGTVGTGVVARSAPDGYSLLVVASGHTIVPWVYRNLPYDIVHDFSGITPLVNFPDVLVVASNGRFRTAQDIAAAARVHPGSITYGTGGVGTATHMNTVRFLLSGQFDAIHVPFKGASEIITELIAGRIDFSFIPLPAALPFIRDKKLRPLAVSTRDHVSVLGNVSTTLEQGFENSDYNVWIGLLTPARTPSNIIETIYEHTIAALHAQVVMENFTQIGAQSMPMRPSEFDQYIRTEFKLNGELAKAAGLTPN